MFFNFFFRRPRLNSPSHRFHPPPFHSFQYNILQKIYFHFGGVELSKHLEVKEQNEKKSDRQKSARSNEHVVYEANINEMTKKICWLGERWVGGEWAGCKQKCIQETFDVGGM